MREGITTEKGEKRKKKQKKKRKCGYDEYTQSIHRV
jgi:hypothetical protein